MFERAGMFRNSGYTREHVLGSVIIEDALSSRFAQNHAETNLVAS
jgi:hypothetical protein